MDAERDSRAVADTRTGLANLLLSVLPGQINKLVSVRVRHLALKHNFLPSAGHLSNAGDVRDTLDERGSSQYDGFRHTRLVATQHADHVATDLLDGIWCELADEYVVVDAVAGTC